MTLVLKKDLKEEDREKLLKKLKLWLDKGKILSSNTWGEKELSYPIKKETRGEFLFLEMEMEAEKGGEIKKKLRLEDDVLRYLLIQTKFVKKSDRRES